MCRPCRSCSQLQPSTPLKQPTGGDADNHRRRHRSRTRSKVRRLYARRQREAPANGAASVSTSFSRATRFQASRNFSEFRTRHHPLRQRPFPQRPSATGRTARHFARSQATCNTAVQKGRHGRIDRESVSTATPPRSRRYNGVDGSSTPGRLDSRSSSPTAKLEHRRPARPLQELLRIRRRFIHCQSSGDRSFAHDLDSVESDSVDAKFLQGSAGTCGSVLFRTPITPPNPNAA